MLGYITAKRAKEEYGLTHHGIYYGIPLWIKPNGDEIIVLVKWTPLEFIFPLWVWIEGLVRSVCFSDEEPRFLIGVGKEI